MELIHQGRHTDVFRTRTQDGRYVVAKTLRGPYPSPEDHASFQREVRITQRIDAPGVISVVDADNVEGIPRLLLEDFGGHSLAIAFRHARPEVSLILKLAFSLVDALDAVHSAHVVHKDVNPSNIVWNPQSGRLALIDFGISAEVEAEAGPSANQALEGTLRYIAPEQTGRIRARIDRRADYYSLGATLYELLTGAPPFPVEDPVALVHAHVAVKPRPPHEVLPTIPECLSKVVIKLLSKRPEDRYQSASGLRHDLTLCQAILEGQRSEADFEVGSADATRDLVVPEKLYGRQRELRALVQQARDAAEGEGRLVLIAGAGGVGKTALVDALWHEKATSRTRFARGKYEQFSRGRPYSAILEVLQDLTRQLLTLSPEELEELRGRLGQQMGQSARVLEEIVPELGHVFGRTVPVPQLSPPDAEVRLHRAVRAFLEEVATAHTPLVVMLDDLQWADSSSLRLLESLMGGEQPLSHLLVIGTYRHDEVGPEHGLTSLMHREMLQDRTHTIRLGQLPESAVRDLLTETLTPTGQSLAPLVAVALAKTRGNPFYLRRFLRALAHDEVLSYEADGWAWQLDAVRAYGASENVAEFMAGKLEELPTRTLACLKAASILGDVFSLEEVAPLVEQSIGDTRTALLAAVAEDIVIAQRARDGGAFRFAHDRIRQAARSLVGGAQATKWHRSVGLRLLEGGGVMFDTVHHLNQAVSLLDLSERRRLASLNLQVGQRALASVAYRPALAFFDAGLRIYDGLDRSSSELAVELRLGASEAAYLSGDAPRAATEIERVLRDSADALVQARALRIRMRQAVSHGRLSDAVDVGLEALDRIGSDVTTSPSKLAVAADLATTRYRLRKRSPAARVDDPELTSPTQQMALEILAEVAPPVYLARQDVLPSICCAMARISAEHGVNPLASYGYALYALILSVLGDYNTAGEYADLSEALGRRFPDDRMKARRAQLLEGFVRHWSRPAGDGCVTLAKGFELGVETGDFVWGAFCGQMYIILSLLSGAKLEGLKEEAIRYTDATKKLGQAHALSLNECYVRAIANLRGEGKDALRLGEEESLHHALASQENDTGLFNFHFVKLLLSVIFEDPSARASAKAAAAYLHAVPATYCVPTFAWLSVLADTQHWSSLSAREKAEALARGSAAELRMRRWAGRVPQNCAAKRFMIDAELARVTRRTSQALAAYDAAIAAARDADCPLEEALAGELAARFQETLGNRRLARAYAREAVYAYARWGASEKVKRMHEADPALVTQGAVPADGATLSVTTSTARGLDIDAAAVGKVSQALSEHLVLEDLVRSLVRIALELSGGTRAVLANAEGEIEASVAAGQEPTQGGGSLRDVADLPQSPFHYVRRTRQDLVIDDAASHGPFVQDPVIQARKIRSLLCVPVVHQGELRASLYVEHDELADAFSPRHLEMLRFLSAQAAISLENATLYANLEKSLETQVRLTTAHSRFVPHQFLQALERDRITDVRLGDHVEKEMSILFSDIRGFTTIVERLSPAENIAFINRYLSFMEPPIIEHGGFVDSYIGDAIMALFDGDADDAVSAGVAMQHALGRLNEKWVKDGQRAVQCGIGVNTGALMLGTIGGSTNIKCGVIGDSVNLASRVESLTKHYAVPMLISGRTYRRLRQPGRWTFRHVERLIPVGSEEAETIYEVVEADVSQRAASKNRTATAFGEAIELYYDRRFSAALGRFASVLEQDPADEVAQRYVERCTSHLRTGVPDDWDGVIRMKTKS